MIFVRFEKNDERNKKNKNNAKDFANYRLRIRIKKIVNLREFVVCAVSPI